MDVMDVMDVMDGGNFQAPDSTIPMECSKSPGAV